MNKLKKLFKYVLVLIVIMIFAVVIINIIVVRKADKYQLDKTSKIPKVDAIIVPGAFVHSNGKVSEMLQDRLDTALEVYKKNKNVKIIVSGDNGTVAYNEVDAMRIYLEQKGIDTHIIFMDHAGFSTYETVYRAKAIFKVKSAIIVTQDYHLKRAVYMAKQMGIEVYGVAADKHTYVGIVGYKIREYVARVKDFVFVNVLRPEPKYLGKAIPVDSSDGLVTH